MTETMMEKQLNIDKSNWKPVKFGDVVEEKRESVTDPEAEGLERIVGLEHIESENFHIKSWGNIVDGTTFTRRFRKGQFLFGRRRAYLKKAALANFEGVCSGDIIVMQAKSGLIPELIPFLISSEKFFDYAIKNSAGSLSPRVKFKDLAEYELLLPPNEQQTRLAELLWAADEVVESITQLLQKANDLRDITREKLFRFGIYVIENKKRKTKKGHAGVIPYEWEEKRFIEIVDITSGQVDPTETEYCDLIQIGSERIEPNTGRIVEKKTAKELNIKSGNYLFTEDDILYSKIRPYFKKVANPEFKGLCSADIYPIRPKNKLLMKKYLFYYMLSEKFTRRLLSFQNRTGMPKVNRDELNSIYIPIPSIDEQMKIIHIFELIDENLSKINSNIYTAKAIQNSLINQVF